MIEYHALLNGIIDCFVDAINNSDGTKNNALEQFDVIRLKRLAILNPKESYLPHTRLLDSLQYKAHWKHELHHEILRELPRGIQPGVIYIEQDKVLGRWSELDYISFLIQIPHDSYLFFRMTYNPKDFILDTLYSCKVIKIEDNVFQLYTIENDIAKTLELLYTFSK